MPVTAEVALVRKTKYGRLAPEFKRLQAVGVGVEEFADQFKMSPDLVARILEFARTGTRPEWSPCCSAPRESAADVKNEPKYVQFASTVAELHDIQRIPLRKIPAEIEATFGVKISEHTVGNAYKYAQAVARRVGNLPPVPNERLT